MTDNRISKYERAHDGVFTGDLKMPLIENDPGRRPGDFGLNGGVVKVRLLDQSVIILGSGSGSVSSVGLAAPSEFVVTGSPIVTAGTLTLTKNSQPANSVWAAPNGGPGVPNFRTLVLGDLPSGIPNAKLANSSLTVTAGTGLSGGGLISLGGATTLSLASTAVIPGTYTYSTVTVDAQGRITTASSGVAPGTVSSVGLAAPASEFTVTGSPVTGSGTLTFNKNSQLANSVWAAPNGGPGVPTFRTLVVADLPSGIPNAKLANSSLTVAAGTGLSGGGLVSLGGTTTLNLASTAVIPGTYTYSTVTIDAQGRITSASSNPINWSTVLGAGNVSGAHDAIMNAGQTILFAGGVQIGCFGVSPGATNATGISIGRSASGSGVDSIAAGRSATASGLGSIAFGQFSTSSGVNGVSIGNGAGSLTGCVAIGNNAQASINTDGTALGTASTASGLRSAAIGNTSTASGTDSAALGFATIASFTSSTAVGTQAQTTAANQVRLGAGGGSVSVAPGLFDFAGTVFKIASSSVAPVQTIGAAVATLLTLPFDPLITYAYLLTFKVVGQDNILGAANNIVSMASTRAYIPAGGAGVISGALFNVGGGVGGGTTLGASVVFLSAAAGIIVRVIGVAGPTISWRGELEAVRVV